MLVESKESVCLRLEAKDTEGRHRQKEQARWNRVKQAAVVEPRPQTALASSLDLASIEALVRSPHLDNEGWLRWTYDTGAAISAFPLDSKIGTETQALQVNSFPTVVASAYREQLSTGME